MILHLGASAIMFPVAAQCVMREAAPNPCKSPRDGQTARVTEERDFLSAKSARRTHGPQ